MVAEGGEKTVAPPLYGRMMRAIRTGHSIGNTIRMLKLPLVFTEQELYFGAIAQFYLLTEALKGPGAQQGNKRHGGQGSSSRPALRARLRK